jgi:acyl-CoA reductase-like NAD-dependent aldehyde dehydrogenase
LRSAISAWRDQRPVGHGHVAGNALAEHMTARCISLMGSTRIGRAYQIAFAKSNSKSVIYDLGGNSLACALEDADIR